MPFVLVSESRLCNFESFFLEILESRNVTFDIKLYLNLLSDIKTKFQRNAKFFVKDIRNFVRKKKFLNKVTPLKVIGHFSNNVAKSSASNYTDLTTVNFYNCNELVLWLFFFSFSSLFSLFSHFILGMTFKGWLSQDFLFSLCQKGSEQWTQHKR